MAAQSEQLERQARRTRGELTATIEELRARMTPGRVVDQMMDYTREGPAAEFLRNLGREITENPLPLVLIGIGVVWLMITSSRTSRAVIGSTADAVEKKATEIRMATVTVARKTREWLPGNRTQAPASAEARGHPSPIVVISDYDETADARALPEMEPVYERR
jgi:hypothetical protein